MKSRRRVNSIVRATSLVNRLAMNLRAMYTTLIAFGPNYRLCCAAMIIALIALLTFSAANAQAPDVTVYVYATDQGKAAFPSYTTSVFLDETLLAKLNSGRYFIVHISAGRHAFFGTKKSRGGVEMDFESGKTYYIRAHWSTPGPKPAGFTLSPPEEGAFDVKQLKPLKRDHVKDPRVVSDQ